MLFFEAGYVFDTSDNTKQRVSEETLIKALRLGVSIQGARLDTNGELQLYDFRAANLQKLKAFSDVNLIFRENSEYLYFISGDLGNGFELSAYAKGLVYSIQGDAHGVIKLDTSLYIYPLDGTIPSGLCFDIMSLPNDTAFIVYSSLIKSIDEGIFYSNREDYIPNVIVDETKHSLFLFGTLLLKGDISNPSKVSHLARGYKETVLPLFKYWYSYNYNNLTVNFNTHGRIKNFAKCELYSTKSLSLLNGILNKGTEEYTMLKLSMAYYSLYGVLPDKFKIALKNISEAVKKHLME